MEKQGRSGILFRCFKEYTKIGLDICAGTCYNIVRKCGHRTSASISAFQAEEVGSIPIARSMQKQRWFVENRRCFLLFYLTFYLITYFKQQNLLFREPTGGFIMKKEASGNWAGSPASASAHQCWRSLCCDLVGGRSGSFANAADKKRAVGAKAGCT